MFLVTFTKNNTAVKALIKQSKNFRNPTGNLKNMYLEYGNLNKKLALTKNKIIMETC